LTAAGFKELRESEQWNIQPLGKVNNENEMINKIQLNFFSILLLKIAQVFRHLLLVENIKMGMVLL
jgi:hypothetical protein